MAETQIETQIELESEQFVSEKKSPKSLFVKHKTQFCTILGFLHNLMNSNIISNTQLDSFIATLPLGKSVSEQISYLDSFDLKDIELNLFKPLHKQFKSRKPTSSDTNSTDMPEKKKTRNYKKSKGKPTSSETDNSNSTEQKKKKRNYKKKTSSEENESEPDSNSDKEIVSESEEKEKESEPVIVPIIVPDEPIIVPEEPVEKKTKKTKKNTKKTEKEN